MRHSTPLRFAQLALLCVCQLLIVACASTDSTEPPLEGDLLQFTAASVDAIDSTAQEIVRANPGNPDLQSLVDSTLMVFTAGIQARRVDVTTNLTTAPLHLVGIHRAVSRPGSSFSTWTLVALDDPSHLTSIIEVSGFAQSASGTAPSSVSGTIGDGTGIVNALLIQVGTAGAVTTWHANTGTVSFSSGAPGAACPGFTPTPIVTCAVETMRVRFNAVAPAGTGTTSSRHASLAAEVDVPAMRLTYTP
jgi:hypothetical protein